MPSSPLQALHYIASTAPKADGRGRRCCMCAAHIDEARAAIGHPPLPAPYLPRIAPETPPVTPAGIEALDAFAAAAEADGRNLMISPATLRELLAKARQAPTPSSSIKHTVHPAGSDLVVEIGDFIVTLSHLGYTTTQHQKSKDRLATPSDHYLPLADTAARIIAALRSNVADYRSQLESLREGKIPRMQQQIDSAFAQRDAVIRQRDEALATYRQKHGWQCTGCGSSYVEPDHRMPPADRLCSVCSATESDAAEIGRCETCAAPIREGDKHTTWADGVLTCEKNPPTPEEIAAAASDAAEAD